MTRTVHTADGKPYKDRFSYDPETLMKAVIFYHDDVEGKGNFADIPGLLNCIRITDEEYEEMKADPDFKPVLTYARRRRESWLMRKSIDNKATNGCKMLLAQEENGAYSDKPADNREKKFIVRLEGAGGIE